MDKTNKISDFLNEDVAYLLGLIVGRGTIDKSASGNRIIINFPFKNLEYTSVINPAESVNTLLSLSNSIDTIISRIKNQGFETNKDNNQNNRTINIFLDFRKTDIAWQLLNYLLNDEFINYHHFRVPRAIFKSDKEKQKEFLRGYFDVTGHARISNKAFGKDNQQRVYLEVDHKNWFLVIDICKILEVLMIPVQSIDFGHPNFRDPKSRMVNNSWAKEHQVKIYANQFLKISSYLSHKQMALTELADMNDLKLDDNAPADIMMRPHRKNIKENHPHEDSDRLPDYIRGEHFNHYSELYSHLIKQDKVKPYG